MDPYVLIMYSLSSFGFIIIFLSLYLLLTVSTKMTPLTRFVIHGHDLSSAFHMLYVTLGVTPSMLLPCTSYYPNGFLTRLGIMNAYNQIWSLFIVVSVSSSFSLLLPINRSFAVSQTMNKWKKTILSIFFFQVCFQAIGVTTVGISQQAGGEKARLACIKRIKSAYPIEMYTLQGINFISTESLFVIIMSCYVAITTILYLGASGICGIILIRSIRNLKKTSQSSVFLANQRRITVGILYFVLVETIALGIPFITFAICLFFNHGNLLIGQIAFLCISAYPIFGPYYVLMSNPDYRSKVSSIMRRAYGRTARIQSVSALTT